MTNKSKIGIPSRTSKEGEGAFLSFLAKYAILHKVCTSDDMGIDYFGEWLTKTTDKSFESTNVLFAIQLKTSEENNIEATFLEKDEKLNQLNRYELKRLIKNGKTGKVRKQKYDNIKPTTIKYWEGFEIPVYLFVVSLSDSVNEIYYKRFTPILHGTVKRDKEKFYKASYGTNFLAFATDNNVGGFCRDLFIDYIRCNYKKGSIAYKNPRDMGLSQFPENQETLFIDMVKKEYKNEIKYTYNRLNKLGFFNTSVCSPSTPKNNSNSMPNNDDTAIPSLAPDDKDFSE